MKKFIFLAVPAIISVATGQAQIKKTGTDLTAVNFASLKITDLTSGTFKTASTFEKYSLLANMPNRFGTLAKVNTSVKQGTASNGIKYFISKDNIVLPSNATGTTAKSSQSNDALICESTPVSLGKQFLSGLFMIPSSQAIENTKIYPGALFKDEDIVKGIFAPMNLPRKPGTIAVNVISSNPVSQNVSNFGDKNTVTSAMSQLLSRVGSSAANTDHSSFAFEFKASDELSLSLESSTSVNLEAILGIPATIGNTLNEGVTLSTEFNTAVAYIRNINYIISVGGTGGVGVVGGPQSTIDGPIPSNAVCVTDVMYGSVAFIIVSNLSTRAEAKFVAQDLLDVADVVSASPGVSAESQRALSIGAVSVMVYGGAGASTVNTVTSVAQLRAELAKGNNTVIGVNAAPIFYALSYASDNAPVKAAAFSSFTDTRCFKASKLEVTLASFKPTNVVDFGDEELYGEVRIDCNGNSTTNNRRFWDIAKTDAIQGKQNTQVSGALADKLTFNMNPAVVDFNNETVKVGINLKDRIMAEEWAFASQAGKDNGFVQYSPTSFTVALSDVKDAGTAGLTKTYNVAEGGATVQVVLNFKLKP
jgi:hypothetical protein